MSPVGGTGILRQDVRMLALGYQSSRYTRQLDLEPLGNLGTIEI